MGSIQPRHMALKKGNGLFSPDKKRRAHVRSMSLFYSSTLSHTYLESCVQTIDTVLLAVSLKEFKNNTKAFKTKTKQISNISTLFR
jgi:hypothetical protein